MRHLVAIVIVMLENKSTSEPAARVRPTASASTTTGTIIPLDGMWTGRGQQGGNT